jgi:hypothetical protein
MALSRNVKHPGYYGFGGAHYVRHPTPGDVFYVTDAARGGADTNDGLTPATPFLTITYALTQLTGLRDSYIFVQRTTPASETWPIEITQSYLHLIGTPDQASPTPGIMQNTNNHGILLSAGGIEIAGFLFKNDITYLKAGIVCNSAQWMNHIHHNWFAWDGDAYDCIVLSGQPTQTAITDNYFGIHGFTNYAILGTAGGGVGRIRIERNVFFQQGRIRTGLKAINLSLDFGGIIRDNVFRCQDNAQGEAITVAGQNGLITGNYAMSGTGAAMGNNPFQEDGTNHWGMNYENGAAQQPA